MKFPYIIAYLVFGILFAEASQRTAQGKARTEEDKLFGWLIYILVILTWPLLFFVGSLLVIIEALKK